jgi:uncharacterized protein YbbC (DUF1343 family)
MAYKLNALRLGGVRFRPIHFKPYFGLFKGQSTHGVQIHVTDVSKFKPTTCTVAIICYLQKHCKQFRWRPERIKGFDKAMGTANVRKMIQAGHNYKTIQNSWRSQLKSFETKANKYKIYK